MVRDTEAPMWRGLVPEDDMASLLMIKVVAHLGQRFELTDGWIPPATWSYRHIHDFRGYRWRNRFSMLLQAFQVAGNRFFNVGLSFFPGRPLRNAPRQGWTMGHKDTVFIRLDDNPEFHKPSVDFTLRSYNILP
jgi:hypothetical protein